MKDRSVMSITPFSHRLTELSDLELHLPWPFLPLSLSLSYNVQDFVEMAFLNNSSIAEKEAIFRYKFITCLSFPKAFRNESQCKCSALCFLQLRVYCKFVLPAIFLNSKVSWAGGRIARKCSLMCRKHQT